MNLDEHVEEIMNSRNNLKNLIELVEINTDDRARILRTIQFHAARGGKLNILKYFLEQNRLKNYEILPQLIYRAAYNNQMHIIKYLVEGSGGSSNSNSNYLGRISRRDLVDDISGGIVGALANNNERLLNYLMLIVNNLQIDIIPELNDMMNELAQSGHLKAIKKIVELWGMPNDDEQDQLLSSAITGRNINLVKYFVETQHIPIRTEDFERSIEDYEYAGTTPYNRATTTKTDTKKALDIMIYLVKNVNNDEQHIPPKTMNEVFFILTKIEGKRNTERQEARRMQHLKLEGLPNDWNSITKFLFGKPKKPKKKIQKIGTKVRNGTVYLFDKNKPVSGMADSLGLGYNFIGTRKLKKTEKGKKYYVMKGKKVFI